jgi:hypothetical protein
MKPYTGQKEAEGVPSWWRKRSMPDLVSFLYKQDLGYLRNTARLWGFVLTSRRTEAAVEELAALLLEPAHLGEQIAGLPDEARKALEALGNAGGRLPWAAFARQYGEIRPAGPARRDRENIHQNPISTAEILYYRALVARGFFETSAGLQEFAFLPDDLLLKLKRSATAEKAAEPLGRPALPKEREYILSATDHLLDDAVTLLTAMRMGHAPPVMIPEAGIITSLLNAAGVLSGREPVPERVKEFLNVPRQRALAILADAWCTSESFNEIHILPGLTCEGGWENHPLQTRRFLLGLLDAVPMERWWSLTAFVRELKEKNPDFQRPAGDYDSWFIKRTSDGTYLRGFSTWEDVDGALVRFLVGGPLHWLGKVDLASAHEGGEVLAFRRIVGPPSSNENARLSVSSSGRITVPRRVPRQVRYQVARFCEWEAGKPDEYRYQVSVASLTRAGRQGLKTGQLLSLLARNAMAEIPPSFVNSLKRWEQNGTEASLDSLVVLKTSRPEVLEELRRSRAGRFLGEILGPTAVVVKPGAQEKVKAALIELGVLADIKDESSGLDKMKTSGI